MNDPYLLSAVNALNFVRVSDIRMMANQLIDAISATLRDQV